MAKRLSQGRNSSIELLRIISILGVVVLHYNNGSMGGGFSHVVDGSINQFYLFFSQCVFIGAVNLFIMISAYYLSSTQKRSFGKIIELVFQVSLYRIVIYLVEIIALGKTFSFGALFTSFLPQNYFVILYSAVYIISPYINILINRLDTKTFRKLLITALILFSIWTIIWDYFSCFTNIQVADLSTISAYGTMQGYTVVNFCLAYLIGAYIRKIHFSISTVKLSMSFCLITAIIFVLSLVANVLGIGKGATWYYNNPLVLGSAACTLLIFLRFDFRSRVINEIAGATFTCYLIHMLLLGRFNIEGAVTGSVLKLIIHQAGVAIICFLFSYFVYKVYQISVSRVFKRIKPLLDKVNISVNIE